MRQIHYLGLVTMLTACADAGTKPSDSLTPSSQDVTQSVGHYQNNGSYTLEGMMPISLTANNQLITTPFNVSGLAFHDEKPASWYFASNDQTRQAGIAVYQEPAQARQGLYATTQQALTDRHIELDQPVNFTGQQAELVYDLNRWARSDGEYRCDNLLTGQQIIDDEQLIKFLLETFAPGGATVGYVYNTLAGDTVPLDANASYAYFSSGNPATPPLLVQLVDGSLPPNVLGERDSAAVLAECRDNRPVRELRPDYGQKISCLPISQEAMDSGQMGGWDLHDTRLLSIVEGGLQAYTGPTQSDSIDGAYLPLEKGLSVRAVITHSGTSYFNVGFGGGQNGSTSSTLFHQGGSTDVGCAVFTPGAPDQIKNDCDNVSLESTTLTATLAVTITPSKTIFYINDQPRKEMQNLTTPDMSLTPGITYGADNGNGGELIIKELCVYRF